MTTSLYDQIYDRIQQEPDRLKRSYSLHDSGVITLTLLVVKKVKEEKDGISPRAHTQANSHRCVLINDDVKNDGIKTKTSRFPSVHIL